MGPNIFSNNLSQISVLVYTESFLNDASSFTYFHNAGKLEGIHIYYMPVVGDANGSFPVETGVYRSFCQEGRTFTAIQFPQCSEVVYTHNAAGSSKTEHENNRLAEERILQGESPLELFHYVVASDQWCKSHAGDSWVISFSTCKEILRLFLVNRKRFWLTEHVSCGETLYYNYYHKRLFAAFQTFWSPCVASGNLSEWEGALDDRLLLFSVCLDQAKIEAYKDQNNTTAMYLKYHISYLLLLITGTLDNLAWLINNLYNMGMEEKERNKVDLLSKDFRKKVQPKSSRIYDLIKENEFMDKIRAVRELRDRIVHRTFIETVSAQKAGDQTQNYLWADKTVVEKLEKAGFAKENFIIRISDSAASDILALIHFLQDTTIEIVNKLLIIIADEVYHSRNQYTIWKLLGFSREPYVL